jgi:hypothetical protein
MRRTWFVLLAVAIAGSAALANDDDGFGQNIAGAWLGTGSFAPDPDCDGVADGPATPFVADSQSFTASGLYISTNPANPNLGHGTWKKTGPRQVTTNNIVYINNAEGELQFIARIPGVFDFEKRFETATSTFGARLYFPTQDPLDPTVTPFFCTVGQHTLLRKVSVAP